MGSIIPQLWFRNTWSWGLTDFKPELFAVNKEIIRVEPSAAFGRNQKGDF